MYNKVAVIGAGFSGLSAAAMLAKSGCDVHLFERHDTAGGRARQFTDKGFVFDMGPSWYWMPDIFERFFAEFGKRPEDYYTLKKLDPSFCIFFGKDDVMDVPADYDALRNMFEEREPGSAVKLDIFMREAQYKYEVSMQDLVYQPSISWREFVQFRLLKGVARLDVFKSLRTHVRKLFKDPALVALMEFPVLFLGAQPQKTPAMYSLMNYAGLKLGTWYPMGGFGAVVDAMRQVAEEAGVHMHMNSGVDHISVNNGQAKGLQINGSQFDVDSIVATADYSYVEQTLLPKDYRSYSDEYWESRTLAPSCLIFYLGINKTLPSLRHHNLFFDEDLDAHAREIYVTSKWPEKPLFYVCCPSKTDPGVAPQGSENMFILMPIAPGLKDNEAVRRRYFELIMRRIEVLTGERVREHISFLRSYSVNDFRDDYHALRGNAYGLANVLRQTAILRPSIRSKKVKNLFYAGHLTVPGPGVPPSIISGQVAAKYLLRKMNCAS